MATTQELIDSLKKDKQNLNSMLNSMGVETTGNETFTKLVPLVGKIVTDPILQDKSVEITENGTTTITADNGYDGLNNVEVTTNVAGSGGGGKYAPRWLRFSSYAGTELDEEMANLDTKNLTNMSYMFSQCKSLTSIDLSNFNTSNATNMSYMFYNNTNLTKADLSSFDTTKVTDMRSMFSGCTNLKTIILGEKFDTRDYGAVNSYEIFKNCTSLESIVIKSPTFTYFDGTNAFQNCTSLAAIYVPDAYVAHYQTLYQQLYMGSYIKPLSEWQG